MPINYRQELESQQEFRVRWLVELDKTAALPNGGWPPSYTKARLPEFREILRRNGLSVLADLPEEIHEFDIFRCMMGDWSPAKEAAMTATKLRRELVEIEHVLAMIDKNESMGYPA